MEERVNTKSDMMVDYNQPTDYFSSKGKIGFQRSFLYLISSFYCGSKPCNLVEKLFGSKHKNTKKLLICILIKPFNVNSCNCCCKMECMFFFALF